ncbi:hypothetical protein HPB52_000436 [Rhipicephalus sanguineus]|uniref:Uncharacterized protein n=1 Tax=Rhipicephalus sanguineus TaxID=34632 RepID=A0A9D4PD67_RHISA|nr:hypothetical protein HPB52_000436 [Rhipicephalus sanguineus]
MEALFERRNQVRKAVTQVIESIESLLHVERPTVLADTSSFLIPTREAWEEYLLGCSALDVQRSLVTRARAAACLIGVPE